MERDEFDLIAVGRVLLGDPRWPSTVRTGPVEQLKASLRRCWRGSFEAQARAPMLECPLPASGPMAAFHQKRAVGFDQGNGSSASAISCRARESEHDSKSLIMLLIPAYAGMTVRPAAILWESALL